MTDMTDEARVLVDEGEELEEDEEFAEPEQWEPGPRRGFASPPRQRAEARAQSPRIFTEPEPWGGRGSAGRVQVRQFDPTIPPLPASPEFMRKVRAKASEDRIIRVAYPGQGSSFVTPSGGVLDIPAASPLSDDEFFGYAVDCGWPHTALRFFMEWAPGAGARGDEGKHITSCLCRPPEVGASQSPQLALLAQQIEALAAGVGSGEVSAPEPAPVGFLDKLMKMAWDNRAVVLPWIMTHWPLGLELFKAAIKWALDHFAKTLAAEQKKTT